MKLLRLPFVNTFSLPILGLYLSGAFFRVLLDSDADLDAELNGSISSEDAGRCSHFLVRQEWRRLSDAHKSEYIRAVKCTRTLPNITSYRGVQSRFDDFQAVHIHTADSIHFVGHFLPWHRRFVSLYETTLREECGYQGAIPYWDWTQDVSGNKSIRTSPVFDPITGFGGDGVKGTYTLPKDIGNSSQIIPSTFVGCVMDGPFRHNASDENSYAVHLGPGKMVTTHCLVRGVDDRYKQFLSMEVVQNALQQPTYEKFRLALEGSGGHPVDGGGGKGNGQEEIMNDDDHKPSEHASGHMTVGGELGNLYSSPGEPLFFLHHANLDRIWWNWQVMDLDRRLTDMSGSPMPHESFDISKHDTTLDPSIKERPEDDDDEYNGIDFDQFNTSSMAALDLGLRFGPLGNTISIRNVMDITESPLCYLYD